MDLEFLTSVLMIVGIDVVLGGDNAIVIALASRNLPESKRNKAILIRYSFSDCTKNHPYYTSCLFTRHSISTIDWRGFTYINCSQFINR